MKRKIIQVAEGTKLVSLPRKWADKFGIKKGEEIDVEEQGNKIIISTEKNSQIESIEVDATGIAYRMVKRVVGALYKSGFDEFKVKFSNAEELKAIQDVVKDTCLGFEIVEQTKDTVTISRVTHAIYEGFNPLFRRTFLFLKAMANQSLKAVKENDANALKEAILMDTNINKLIDFCRRMLNKKENIPLKNISTLYYIAEQIEKTADSYKKVCNYLLERKSTKLSKEVLEIYQDVNGLLEAFYDLFYNFDLKKANEFRTKHMHINDGIKDALLKVPRKDLRILIGLNNISRIIYTVNGAIIMMNFSNGNLEKNPLIKKTEKMQEV